MPVVSRTKRRFVALGWIVAGLTLASACRVDVVVDIAVDEIDGGLVTMTVAVDDEVLEYTPDWTQQVETSDLVAAGWVVEVSPGGEMLTLRRPFSSAAELAALLADIGGGVDGDATAAGQRGLFSNVELLANYDGATSRYELSLDVNLQSGVEDFINPATADLFGGNLFGVPTEELVRRAGKDLNETVNLVVQASVPQGSTRLPADGTLRLNEGGARQLRLASEFVDDELVQAFDEADLAQTKATQQTLLVLLLWLALASAAILGVYLYLQSVRRRKKLAVKLPRGLWR